jgi:hypothetical protein
MALDDNAVAAILTPVHQSLELECFRERRKLGSSDHKRQPVASAMEPSIPRYRKAAPEGIARSPIELRRKFLLVTVSFSWNRPYEADKYGREQFQTCRGHKPRRIFCRTQISEDGTARDGLLFHSRYQMSSRVIIYRARESGWALDKPCGLLSCW